VNLHAAQARAAHTAREKVIGEVSMYFEGMNNHPQIFHPTLHSPIGIVRQLCISPKTLSIVSMSSSDITKS
jgi:hypothetical protein